MGRIEEGDIENKSKDKKTEIYMVSKIEVIKALRKELKKAEAASERGGGDLDDSYWNGKMMAFTNVIDAISELKGEWK